MIRRDKKTVMLHYAPRPRLSRGDNNHSGEDNDNDNDNDSDNNHSSEEMALSAS